MRIRYDLHIHSCLSPCGEDSMTPAFIAGSCKLLGLDLAALTDHNSAKNCPAFFRAAEFYGLTPLGGLELSTVEGVHVLCLFEQLEQVMAFDEYVSGHLIRTENDPAFFGRQLICDEEDRILSEERWLLSGDTDLPFDRARACAERFGGVALPAHIDRTANGAVAFFGTVPKEAGFTAFELRDRGNYEKYRIHLPAGAPVLYDSDAHTLDALGSAGGALTLDDALLERLGPAGALLFYLRSGQKSEVGTAAPEQR